MIVQSRRGGYYPPGDFVITKSHCRKAIICEIPIICIQMIGRAVNNRPYNASKWQYDCLLDRFCVLCGGNTKFSLKLTGEMVNG